mmetsp:Transcript_12211/g.22894  ORF Transcript_12211/g.22894 Transcript_12211/m.22894 type:complete len:1322 (-) Transcript_12211:95-4060(-)
MSNDTTEDSTKFSEWISNCMQKGVTIVRRNDARTISKEYFLQTPGERVPQELAALLATLGPAVSSNLSTLSSKVMALSYILGAFDVFRPVRLLESSVSLPLEMMNSVSNFMLELCGPFADSSAFDPNGYHDKVTKDNENGDVVLSDDVRDEAMRCVCALLETESSDAVSISSCMQFRVKVAKRAVQRRCMSIDDCDTEEYGDDDDDDYDMKESGAPTEEEAKILSDLSLLPRAKRSLCFHILEAAVNGLDVDKAIGDGLNSDVTSLCCKDLVEFTVFASSCLHGETDPRCLMQMLRLLQRILFVISPIVESARSLHADDSFCAFPFTTMFDAVAVYYPVRFTPPPNDPHGITREGIHHLLMGVLTYTDSSNENNIRINKDETTSMSMTTLAAGLFLERISPPRTTDLYDDDDDAQDISTVRDRIEALDDLNNLIYKGQEDTTLILKQISLSIVKEMSNALYRCHEDAASSVTKSEQDMIEYKKLADSCRHFVRKIAYDFEKLFHSASTRDNDNFSVLWNVFVGDRVEDVTGVIVSSPQSLKGRMGTAYLASLAACGGEKTLRLCLDSIVPSLIAILETSMHEGDANRDEEKVSTIVYSLSALFSSCKLSMEQIHKEGINIHPHPLEIYASTVLQALCHIIERSQQDVMDELEISAVQALESLLLSIPGSILKKSEDNNTNCVKNIIKSTSEKLLSQPSYIEGDDAKWKIACARFLGSVVGKGLHGGKVESDHNRRTLLESDAEIVSYVETYLYPFVMESSKKIINDADTKCQRCDWTILTYACEVDQEYAVRRIVSQLYKDLVSSVKCAISIDERANIDEMVNIAKAISHVMKSGGPEVTTVFHGMSQKEDDGADILDALISNPKQQVEKGDEMSSLLLPEMRALYRSQADKAIKISHVVLPHMLPVYSSNVPDVKVEEILNRVSQVIPPLSDWDGVELSTLLPILSIILANDTELGCQNHIRKTLVQIVPDLVDYTLNKEANLGTRSAAASCSFSIISKYQEDMNSCIGLNLMRCNITPHIVNNIESLSAGDFNSYHRNDLVDSLNLAAMIASASSQRGGASARTADEIARFLALLSCEGAANVPSLGIDQPLDCNSDIYKEKSIDILLSSATALGSIFHRKTSNPFAKQRLAHITLPIILSSGLIGGSELSGTHLGSLLCASHILNCVQVKAFDHDTLSKLSAMLVAGLDKVIPLYVLKEKTLIMLGTLEELLSLILTAILKLYYEYPSVILPELGTIVPSSLLVTMCADQISSVPLNLIAIQLLSSIVKFEDDRVVHFCKAYKHKVLANLSKCLDHPSTQVRRATVRAMNLWSVYYET